MSATHKQSAAAIRAARSRRLRKMISARIDRARNEAWEELIRACAEVNPRGTCGGFERWFRGAWLRSLGGGQ
jgi:hypothetical protein